MSDCSLRLGEAELGRHRTMAQPAAEDEAADWAFAGIRPGAHVADVGCGPHHAGPRGGPGGPAFVAVGRVPG